MATNTKGQDLFAGLRKAAIVLISLGDQAAAELLRQLPEEDVQLVSQEVARLTTITSEQAENVLEEFYQLSIARDYMVRGGMEYARKMLIEAYGPVTSRKLLDRLASAVVTDLSGFDLLQQADPQLLAKYIHNEHPQTIALILSHLDPSHGVRHPLQDRRGRPPYDSTRVFPSSHRTRHADPRLGQPDRISRRRQRFRREDDRRPAGTGGG